MSFHSVKMTHVDGTMHHLGVKEEQVAKSVILVPDPQSVPFFAEGLDNAVRQGDYREYVTYTGSYAGKPLTVMSSGFGCMPMAIAVEELWHLGVRQIVKLEACAAIEPDRKPGDFCFAKGAVRGEGASREYIDDSYPAVPDMLLLSKLCEKLPLAELCLFRSHDFTSHETPRAPQGMERLRYWNNLGVELLDGGTSALFVLGSILRLPVASAAVVSQNYMTGEALTGEQQQKAIRELFARVAEALVCC